MDRRKQRGQPQHLRHIAKDGSAPGMDMLKVGVLTRNQGRQLWPSPGLALNCIHSPPAVAGSGSAVTGLKVALINAMFVDAEVP